MDPYQFLLDRRSIPARQLGDPGPDADQLQRLLAVAIRVPDHGKLTPWRLLLIRGEVRRRLGLALAEIHRRKDPTVAAAQLDKDQERFVRAPLVIAVIARLDPAQPKVPVQEQLLSAGCVAYNLLLGAHALGFGAQWLTGWPAYDADAARLLGLLDHERVVAFVHVGTPCGVPPERTRPALRGVVGELELPSEAIPRDAG
jgi:nitroreductase